MTREINIGASISDRTDASQQVEVIFAEGEFPRSLSIQNHLSTRLVLPELKALDIAPLNSSEAHFKDLGTLKRVVSSIAQIARLNSFPLVATIYALESPQEPDPVNPFTETSELQATDTQSSETTAEADSNEVYAVLVETLESGFIRVAVDGVQFQIKNTQLRENGSLTAGGITAYQAALAATNE